jgi:hypothetical protein
MRTLWWDLRLQLRYGMGYAALFVSAVWLVLLALTPASMHGWLLPLALMFDTAIFGFYLMAGLMFLEKSDRTLSALVVTPLSATRYLLNKVITLTGLALVPSILVVAIGYRGAVQWPLLVAGVCLGSAMMMLAGFALAARFRSINAYFLPSAAIMIVAQVPLLHYFGVVPSGLMYLLPTRAPLLLIEGAIRPLAWWQIAYGLGYGVAATAAALWWARRSFVRFIAGGADALAGRVEPPTRGARERRWSGVWALALADWRNLRRDPIQVFMLFYAVLLGVIGRWLLPWVLGLVSPWVDLKPYFPLIISWMALQAVPLILGAVVGMMLLDERDDGSLLALRVTPLPLTHYALYRAAVPVMLSVVMCIVSVYVIGLWIPATAPLIAVSVMAALEGPMLALTIATIAGNKVEGLALMKGISIFMWAPVLAWFVDPPWRWLVGLVPTYWPAEAFWRAGGIGGEPWGVIVVGLALHVVILGWLLQRFRRKHA